MTLRVKLPDGGSPTWAADSSGAALLRSQVFPSAPPPAGSGLRAWDGSAWRTGTLRVWNGSVWQVGVVRRWNGSAWV